MVAHALVADRTGDACARGEARRALSPRRTLSAGVPAHFAAGCAGAGPCAVVDDLRRPRHHRRLEPVGSLGETAYGHSLSRRIIGNALIAYLLCQAWGNQPERFRALLAQVQQLLEAARDGWLNCAEQDRFIETLLRLDGWGYELPSEPPLVVLDTRTRRWRSERNLSRPSGLMDWEALSELQQNILDKPSVLIVSPAPMFGVKLIEAVQRVFSWAGQPLLVDAENWMAHRGAAHVMMNIFRHSRTPGNYVILSGDVHYSRLRSAHPRPRQRAEGLADHQQRVKNEFPRRLLDWFDRLNRWLYAPWSPLNWLTKRRRLEVVPRVPDRSQAGERLWNGSGIGLLVLDEQGRPREIIQLNADGSARWPSFHERSRSGCDR